MAALTSGSWTIAFRNDRSQDSSIGKRKRMNSLKLTLASGSPPASLTLPGSQSVGMIRNLDRYYFDRFLFASGEVGSSVSGNAFFTYNATGNSIKFYRMPDPGVFASGTGRTGVAPLVTTAVTKALTFYVVAEGW